MCSAKIAIRYNIRMADNIKSYSDTYHGIDFRKNPEKYRIGKGEKGVLVAEPYKSEILPFWRFATPDAARKSSAKIYDMFKAYGKQKDFVGMDMARKFLQMGFTRSRRYANHASGHKYNDDGTVKSQDVNSEQSDKAESARIFYELYAKAKSDPLYVSLKEQHKKNQV